MKIIALLFAAAFAVCARGAEVATTNVVEYTDAQKNERAARAAAWREAWAKMTPEEKAAHREAAQRKLQEQRAASGEVSRTTDENGNIVITYRDGTVRVHKCGK